MSKIIVIGAGFSGSTSAYLLAQKGYQVQVIEADSHPGGGCWTRFYGQYPYTIGPRIFYTNNQKVFDFINNIVPIREFDTRTMSYISSDDRFYNYPLQNKDVESMDDFIKISNELNDCKKNKPKLDDFEVYWISAIGPTLYEKFVKNYSLKMWMLHTNSELSADFNWVNRGTPIRNGDTRLFGDQMQGYPFELTGYNKYFHTMLKDVSINYNEKVIDLLKVNNKFEIITTKGTYTGDIVINTGFVDEIFNYKYGALEYAGRDIENIILPINTIIPDDYHWIHYSGMEGYTRITDFNKITGFNSKNCFITIEKPSNKNRLYPKQTKPELMRYSQYQAEFPKSFFSIGRLGKHKYTGISDAIEQAFEVVENIN